MKKFVFLIFSIFFFFTHAWAEEAVDINYVQYWLKKPDESGWCEIHYGRSIKSGRIHEKKVCPQHIDEFYKDITVAQKKEAIEKGLALLSPGFAERHPDKWERVALSKFFRQVTGKI